MAQSPSSMMVDLEPLSTPREECLFLRTGVVDIEVVRDAKHNRFDQLPVLDGNDRLCGLIATECAAALSNNGETLEPDSTHLTLIETDATAELFDLLRLLGEHRAIILRGSVGPDWFALVTISDLNRHPFRAVLYVPLVNLELALAELIVRAFDEPWEWIELTGNDAQVRIVGQWEVQKRANTDTHPVTGCTLTDLIKVVDKTATLRERLGFKAKKAYVEATKHLPNLRNQTMHPVRPLILGQDDVVSLLANVRNVMAITDQVRY